MEYTYENNILPYADNYTFVELNEDEVKRIEKLTDDVVSRKHYEIHHKFDCRKEYNRFFNGFIGELAVEKLLGISVVDWSVGNSINYNKPDIRGYNVGVKTVEKGKFPIIFKDNYYSQIICIKCSRNVVFVCGLATKETLNKYQSDDLIIDSRLREKGTKTGFYGFSHLINISSKNDLDKLVNNA